VIDLWDKLYPNKFIAENMNREEVFEGMIMDLIFQSWNIQTSDLLLLLVGVK
jgi:hypothetical protein